MISKIESGVFEYLVKLLESYGVPMTFKYDPDLDVLTEFRRSIKLRIENQTTFSTLIDNYKSTLSSDDGKVIHNLGLYNRSALQKSTVIGNNMDLQVWSRKYSVDYGIELRNMFFGTTSFSIKLLFDSNEMADIFELVYAYELSGKQKTVLVDYDLGENTEPIEEVQYNVLFNPIDQIGALNTSNLRFIDLSIDLSGLVFLPFYSDGQRLETIELSIHVMNPSVPPSPKNATEDTLYERKVVAHYPV